MAQKILIAEDERALAKVLQLKLKNNGFEVDIATDGQQALDQMAKNQYDLLILDLVMPNIDGFHVLEQLQTQGNTTPIIVASNLSQEGDFDKAKKLGAKDYFIKSNTSLADLTNKIIQTLNKGKKK